MTKREARQALGLVCVGARSLIITALYFAAFLAAVQLATFLPEPWSAVGITVLLLVTVLPPLGRWPGREFRLESVGLGYPDRQANPQAAAPVSPTGVPCDPSQSYSQVRRTSQYV